MAASDSSPKRSWLEWATTPDDSLSYDFLCVVYAFLAAISILLFALERVWDAEGIKGYWIITAPCIPGLIYFLMLRAKAGKKASGEKKQR